MATKFEPFGGSETRPGIVFHKQNFALAVVVITPFISLAFTALRFWAKRRSGWGADDWTVFAAALLSILLIYPSYRFIRLLHFGIHLIDINQRYLEPDFRKIYTVTVWINVVNSFVLPLVKASIMLLLLKVGGVLDKVRKFVYVVFAFNAITACVVAIWMLFMCPQRTGNTWAPSTFGGARCAGRLVIGRLAIFQVCVNMLTDLLIFPIPCYLTWRLQKASFRNRLIVVFLFSLSLAVTAIGGVKIFYTYRDRLYISAPDDWTWDIYFTITHWENCVAIVVACIPSLRVLILRWLGKDDLDSRATGASPMHITGGTAAGATAKSGRDTFLQRLRPPSKKRGLYDTTIGDQTVDLDLERCDKPSFGETLVEEDASCSSKIEMYSRSESVSTTAVNEPEIQKPGNIAMSYR